MERASFKEYKGKLIYYVDYSEIKTEKEFLEVLKMTNRFRIENIENKALNSQLMLVNFQNSFIVGNTFDRLKESAKAAKPYLKKQAVIGISLAKKVMLNIYNQITNSDVKIFSNEADALEWLIER
jgi:hypothetical protein